jgi:integral membrane sensor domain MASE1
MDSSTSVRRFVAENVFIALAYWGLSHLNFLVFRQVGVLPMPIWPAAGLAFVVAFYRGWRIGPGIALGTILANHFSLGGAWALACCIAVMNTLGPLAGASLARGRVSRELNLGNLVDVLVFFSAAMILTPMLTATGGIGSRWLLGLIPGDAVVAAWLKWAMAHSLGTLFIALPAFAWLKRVPGP